MTSAAGRLTGEQEHVYGYAPIGGLHLTANAGLTSARVRTGTSIAPSAVDLRFHTVGAVEQSPCALVGGGRGTFQIASGTLSATTFAIATGTTPFFGTITTVPATATVVHDPGCATFVAAAARRPVFHRQCGGRETIQQSTLTSVWLGELGFGGGRVDRIRADRVQPVRPRRGQPSRGRRRPGHEHARAGAQGGRRRQGRRAHRGRAVHGRAGPVHIDRHGPRLLRAHVHLGAPHLPLHDDPLPGPAHPGELAAAILFDTGATAITPTRATLVLHKYTK